MMDPKDRIALVLFENEAKLYYDINYLTPENKSKIKDLINNINIENYKNLNELAFNSCVIENVDIFESINNKIKNNDLELTSKNTKSNKKWKTNLIKRMI